MDRLSGQRPERWAPQPRATRGCHVGPLRREPLTSASGLHQAAVRAGAGPGSACAAHELARRGAHVVIGGPERGCRGGVRHPLSPVNRGSSTSPTPRRSTTLRSTSTSSSNNAGIQRVSPIASFDPDAFRLIQRLMVESPFLLAARALRLEGWGRIVDTPASTGARERVQVRVHVTAKHGLRGRRQVTRSRLRPHGSSRFARSTTGI